MSGVDSDTRQIELNPRVRYRVVGEDGVLIQMDEGRVIVINETGLQILQYLKQPQSKSELASRLVEEFDISQSQALADTCEFITQLENENVISYRE